MALPLTRLFRAFALISLCVFSTAMLLIAPFELYQVKRVRHWARVPARMVKAGYRRADFEPYETYGYFRFIDLSTGQTIETSDARPGDLPFSISVLGLKLFDTKGYDLKAYATGRNFMALRAPDGRHYFLESRSWGPMSGLFLASLGWWGYIAVRARKRGDREDKRSIIEANKIGGQGI